MMARAGIRRMQWVSPCLKGNDLQEGRRDQIALAGSPELYLEAQLKRRGSDWLKKAEKYLYQLFWHDSYSEVGFLAEANVVRETLLERFPDSPEARALRPRNDAGVAGDSGAGGASTSE